MRIRRSHTSADTYPHQSLLEDIKAVSLAVPALKEQYLTAIDQRDVMVRKAYHAGLTLEAIAEFLEMSPRAAEDALTNKTQSKSRRRAAKSKEDMDRYRREKIGS